MRPYLITAARNPLLWIVPAVLLPLLVAVGAFMTSRQSQVQASIWTQNSSLIDIPGGSLKPPAQIEADTFNERLRTEAFRTAIITAAGLDERAKSGDWPSASPVAKLLASTPITRPLAGFFGGAPGGESANRSRALEAVTSSLKAEAQGENLMYITYAGGDATTGVALVNGAVDTYVGENLGQNSAQAKAVLDFYTQQVAERQQALADADTSLRAFEAEHPAALGVPRPASEAQQLAQLQSIYNIRLSEYELAINRQGDAQVRAQASLTTTGNDFQVVDPAQDPLGSALQLHRFAMLTFAGILFGCGLGALLVVLRTWLDETVRRREDIKALLSFDILAALPDLRKERK